jgi:hypothetical protein
MRLLGQKTLTKLKEKNKGNKKLGEAIDRLIKDLTAAVWKNQADLFSIRNDADSAHPEGFYFFDIDVHRTNDPARIWGRCRGHRYLGRNTQRVRRHLQE